MESKKETNNNTTKPLSNVQKELLKLYSLDLSKAELEELKTVLGKYFAQRATNKADKIWEKKKYTEDTIEKWLNET